MVAGDGIASPTGQDIDGKYLDQNEQDLKMRYIKFQKDWPLFGVTLMCDSWTGPTRMSVINFLIYCNGVMWLFHNVVRPVDASGTGVPCHEACFTMLFVPWMRAELEYFCLAAYKGSQSVVAQET